MASVGMGREAATLTPLADSSGDTVTPWLDDGDVVLHHGNCAEVMADMPAESIDAVITDPPYGIGFMGHQWDQPGFLNRRNGSPGVDSRILNGGSVEAGRYDQSRAGHLLFQEWCEHWAQACARVLRPGGHLVSFAGARTYHRLACGVEDAGLEIRDQLQWLFGEGFPKSIKISGANPTRRGVDKSRTVYSHFEGQRECEPARGRDIGGASRFYYCAKASDADRGHGNTHPTVKPSALMRWIIRLIVPPGATILDPFCGSGTTAVAARLEGIRCIGIDRELAYLEIAAGRLGQASLLSPAIAPAVGSEREVS